MKPIWKIIGKILTGNIIMSLLPIGILQYLWYLSLPYSAEILSQLCMVLIYISLCLSAFAIDVYEKLLKHP